MRVTLRFLMPPSVGDARARARGELLERSLTRDLGERVEVEVAESYDALRFRVRARDVELAWLPSAVCAQCSSHIHAVYRVVRAGRSTYRSALVADRAAHLGLSRLRGARAAWVDPLSLGGYLLVRAHLVERGLVPEQTFASERFLGSHPAALSAVLDGDADVAAVSVAGDEDARVEEALALHGGRAGATRLEALLITQAVPTDALILTRALKPSRADALTKRITAGLPALRLAMEADALEPAKLEAYARIAALLPER